MRSTVLIRIAQGVAVVATLACLGVFGWTLFTRPSTGPSVAWSGDGIGGTKPSNWTLTVDYRVADRARHVIAGNHGSWVTVTVVPPDVVEAADVYLDVLVFYGTWQKVMPDQSRRTTVTRTLFGAVAEGRQESVSFSVLGLPMEAQFRVWGIRAGRCTAWVESANLARDEAEAVDQVLDSLQWAPGRGCDDR